MAFSFRAGTNWYHDFPKLARESGFYFNMHSARVRVDWNRISNIDIDRIIRERDFQIVDENFNNVIDYYLESEYDVKILDPNFVKLFRLAQLAVEYLLYCKQYLDQSVVILKEELKFKIEENIKLKEEITQLQDSLEDIKEKHKEKNKATESKFDTHGEIHKCPWCPKTFISQAFANAHLLRRHSNFPEISPSLPSVQEGYKTETEILHNEIKTLKERLNQTERIIRNESNNIMLQNEILKKDKKDSLQEDSLLLDDQCKKYQNEISDLKTMFFTEIKNIKKKENNFNHSEIKTNHENFKELLNQQEQEIEMLKTQLQEHLTSNKSEVEVKLLKQEEYWKNKIEQLENQYHNDIKQLFNQMKLNQDSATNMKSNYEEKISFLEQQYIDQSKLLTTQTEQLKNLSNSIQDTQNKKFLEIDPELFNKQGRKDFIADTIGRESKENIQLKNTVSESDKQFPSNFKFNQKFCKLLRNKKRNHLLEMKTHESVPRRSCESKLKETQSEKNLPCKRTDKKFILTSKSNETTNSTGMELESNSDEETEDTSYEVMYTDSTDDEAHSEAEEKLIQQNKRLKKCSPPVSTDIIKNELEENFNQRLRNLGIDPEWDTLPIDTFKEKMENIKHYQNISSKKFSKYDYIRKKLLEEIFRKIHINHKPLKKHELKNNSFLNKTAKNVKSKTSEAPHKIEVRKDSDTSMDTSISVESSKNSSPREIETRHKLSPEALPNKSTELDVEETRRHTKFKSVKDEESDESIAELKSNFNSVENMNYMMEDALKCTKQLQRSYQTIEAFMRDIEETPQLENSNTEVQSFPTKIPVQSILQDSGHADINSQFMSKNTAESPVSSNNKSVLKSVSGSIGSLIKKKVLFDLDVDRNSYRRCE